MLHFLRSLWYRRVTFRRRRKLVDRLLVRAEAAGAADTVLVPEVFIVVTSYRIPGRDGGRRVQAAIARRPLPRAGHIVAAIVEMADQRLAKDCSDRLATPPGTSG